MLAHCLNALYIKADMDISLIFQQKPLLVFQVHFVLASANTKCKSIVDKTIGTNSKIAITFDR